MAPRKPRTKKPVAETDDNPPADNPPADTPAVEDRIEALESMVSEYERRLENLESPRPYVGRLVSYRISQGPNRVPLVITQINGDCTVDGIAFSTNYREVSNYRGTEPVRGAAHGEGPLQWLPID